MRRAELHVPLLRRRGAARTADGRCPWRLPLAQRERMRRLHRRAFWRATAAAGLLRLGARARVVFVAWRMVTRYEALREESAIAHAQRSGLHVAGQAGSAPWWDAT